MSIYSRGTAATFLYVFCFRRSQEASVKWQNLRWTGGYRSNRRRAGGLVAGLLFGTRLHNFLDTPVQGIFVRAGGQ